MTTICPKCRYARKDSDTAPAWQCPSCQVAYSKVGNDNHEAVAAAGRYRAEPDKSSGNWKWALGLAIVLAVAWQARHAAKRSARDSTRPASVQAQGQAQGQGQGQGQGQPEIVLYSASWCGYCTATREFFKDNGIRFTELDIENTAAGAEGYAKLGAGGVPLIVVGDELVRGYNEAGLRQMLHPWLSRT